MSTKAFTIAIFLGKYFKKSVNTVSLLEQTARIKGVYTNITISTCRLKQNIFNYSTAKKKKKN